jgi:short subunit dehydrogenase-like uncharacterized protein
MLLENKIAVIYGAGGAVGGTVAKAFAREGAKVFLTGRNLKSVDAVAKEITAADGKAESAVVDALDEMEVENHLPLSSGTRDGSTFPSMPSVRSPSPARKAYRLRSCQSIASPHRSRPTSARIF